jgi:hypothetical protein
MSTNRGFGTLHRDTAEHHLLADVVHVGQGSGHAVGGILVEGHRSLDDGTGRLQTL